MRRHTLVMLAAVLAVVLLAESQARAQAPGSPYGRPTYSPYLNLFRRNAPFYQNYYGLVRPQVQFNNQIQNLQQQTNANQAAIAQEEQQQSNLPTTGHSFGYQNHLGKFLNHTRGGGAGARGPGGGATGNVGSFGGAAGGAGSSAIRR